MEFNGPLFRYIDSPEQVYSLMGEYGSTLAKTARPNPEPRDEQRIRGWLLNGERLLWAGAPCPDDEPTWRDFLSFLLIIPYVFVAGAIVGEAFETREPRREGVGAVSDMTLALIIAGAAAFFLFGLYGGFFHHLVDSYKWNTTFYGLTDQRTIVETWRSVRFVPLGAIISLNVKVDERGKGTISCLSDAIEGLDFSLISFDAMRESPFDGPLFHEILDTEHVHTLLSDARQARIMEI
jgi:hypothetical protein